jgi:peptide/nickel transport system ATP-binding protein
MTALLEVDNLGVRFTRMDAPPIDAVSGVSFSLEAGKTLGIVGESGSGKSLTGRALLGLLPDAARWSARTMRFAGHDLLAMSPRDRRRLCGSQMGMILQDPKYSLNPVMTVAKQMGEAFRLHEPGLRGRALRERILERTSSLQGTMPFLYTFTKSELRASLRNEFLTSLSSRE